MWIGTINKKILDEFHMIINDCQHEERIAHIITHIYIGACLHISFQLWEISG